MNRIAVIVIGSNSTRLLAADACMQLTNELRGRVETRLFLGMSDDKMLSEEAMQYTVQSVSQLKQKAEQSGAQLLGIYATSASRDASNSDKLSALIEKATGHPLTILSGEEEAAYSFFGAAGLEKCGVIDIGGGSTEIVLGCGTDIFAAHSLQLGASRLFKSHAIKSSADLPKVFDIIKEQLTLLSLPLIHHEGISTFYLLGGTGNSCARIMGQVPEGCVLSRKTIEELLLKIADTPREERALIPGFPPSRIDILPTGMSILLSVLDALDLPFVRVSERVNADGLLRAYVHKKFA